MARLIAIRVLEPAIVDRLDPTGGQVILTEEGERLHCDPKINNPDASNDDDGFLVEIVTAGGRGEAAWIQSNWTFELAGEDSHRRRIHAIFGDRVDPRLEVTGSTGDPPPEIDGDPLDWEPKADQIELEGL